MSYCQRNLGEIKRVQILTRENERSISVDGGIDVSRNPIHPPFFDQCILWSLRRAEKFELNIFFVSQFNDVALICRAIAVSFALADGASFIPSNQKKQRVYPRLHTNSSLWIV